MIRAKILRPASNIFTSPAEPRFAKQTSLMIKTTNNSKSATQIRARNERLTKLKRKGNVLEAPSKQIPNLQFTSWIENGLPNILWAILLVGTLPRDDALRHFRSVLNLVAQHKNIFEDDAALEHSKLATLSQDQFNQLFGDLCKDERSREVLSALLLFESLPDRKFWEALLPSPSPEKWTFVASAVAASLDHQSQEATDCRWLKVMTLILAEKLLLPPSMKQRLDEYLEYPNKGDMKAVRPSIRALEISTRPGSHPLSKDSPAWNNSFWNECWEKTECLAINPDINVWALDHADLAKQIHSLHNELTDHFISAVTTTAADPKLDSTFGLAFYIMQLLHFCLEPNIGSTVQGRVALRSAVEAYITLAYLAHKDDPTIWLQYRNYGSGQAKLAYLKHLDLDEAPSFISAELLQSFANEDIWMEHLDIKLGAWANKNLRTISEEAGLKTFYDTYYDALSGYVHANWAAVRHAAFAQCANPLHRLHRIPIPPRKLNEDTVPDLAKICNLALEKVAHLFPPFKSRLKWRNAVGAGAVDLCEN
ncbi:DUF5677 domain-containing protein [Bradyrhizobium sp. U87765 SZCCT0134]|uniref:DUF5677 domain-containing protein n=2 Tax=Bradyrhizobium TaxID=374 RepID=UPI001BAD3365|nr:DUF5677 domain-containing protein [Bradyrhizobium sp. U87765 SZCCT0134]MBR1350848.1 hypothetical protein [Bradyrhizobium sp. U87765 SZCCT0048]